MKKIAISLCLSTLVVAFIAISASANNYMLSSTKGASGIEYISTVNNTLSIEINRNVITSNSQYRTVGAYYKVVGASIAASANNTLCLAIGSGSTSTASYVPRYDVAIPMINSSTAVGVTNNLSLAYGTEWYVQGIMGGIDYRGDTLNIEVQPVPGSTTNVAISQIFVKLEKVAFGLQ